MKSEKDFKDKYLKQRTIDTLMMNSPFKMKKELKKGNKENRNLRRGKTIKEQSDPDKFCGAGIDFKAKIIGTEHVLDARGNRMCQGALQRLKAAVKTSGDHKQRVILNISLEGIIIKDEKSGEALHHHPIHKISFISQDTKDNRAFGYVFGCPQTGHEFFGIKTEKVASQVVLTLRDLFLTALEMKKREIALEKARGSHDTEQETEHVASIEAEKETSSALLDLQFTMNSLQQGISHMDESIATHQPSEDNLSECSSNSFKMKMNSIASVYQETLSISSRSSSISEYSGCVPETPPRPDATNRYIPADFRNGVEQNQTSPSPSQETIPSSNLVEDRYAVFQDIDALPSIFDNPGIFKDLVSSDNEDQAFVKENSEPESVQQHEISMFGAAVFAPPVAFAELDPLGNHPYVDKKYFFQDLKKPPKKALNAMVPNDSFIYEGHAELEEIPNCFGDAVRRTSLGSCSIVPPSPQRQLKFKYPTNPFVDNDMPPPTSPPPPPPPRLPTRMSTEMSSVLPPNGTPTPPLPRRRSNLSSTSQNWFSFDQDAIAIVQTQSTSHREEDPFTPPLPSPARKLPTSTRKSGSPASYQRSPALSRHHSVAVESEVTQHSYLFDCQKITEMSTDIPPLPPKPNALPRPLMVETRHTHASSSLSGSNISSAGGHSSSSLVFSSSDDAKIGSGSEALFESDEGHTQNGSIEKAALSLQQEQSPDSIFRRNSDPFSDEFFLTLPKKSNTENGSKIGNLKYL